MKVSVYSAKGVKTGQMTLPKEFGEKPNMALLAQAIRVYEDGGHTGLSKTKTRAEVNRTTKKLYRQKGTGGARHGSRRAPIFVGGGVAHGPRPIRRVLSLPSKMKKKALAVALSLKAKNGEIVGVSGIEKMVKVKEVHTLATKILKELKNVKRLTIALADSNLGTMRAIKNLVGVTAVPFRNLNAYQVHFGGGLVIDKDAIEKKIVKAEKEIVVVKTKIKNKKNK